MHVTHLVCEGNRESGGFITRPTSTLSERLAPLDIDINDIDGDNPGAGVYADLYRKCPPIPGDSSRHRHQTTCLVHGDAAPQQGNPESPRDGCFRRSAAKSSQSQSLLPPPLGHHHDDVCARHRRCADDVFSKGDGGSSFLLAEQDSNWCGVQNLGGHHAGCHVCPTNSYAVPMNYHNQTTADVGYACKKSQQPTEQRCHDIVAMPPLASRVFEEMNGAFASEQPVHLNEITYARQTPDYGHASGVSIPQQRNDINGNSIRGSYHDFGTAFNYSMGNSFSGRSPDCVPIIESVNPPSNTYIPPCPQSFRSPLKAYAPNSDWRHSMGDASSVTGELARQAPDASGGVTGQSMVDETSFGTRKRDTDRLYVQRRRRQRGRITHVKEHEDSAARAVPSDASMTSRSTEDSADLTWLNRLVKRPTSPPLHSPPESDVAGLAPYQPPLAPQLAAGKLQSEVGITARNMVAAWLFSVQTIHALASHTRIYIYTSRVTRLRPG